MTLLYNVAFIAGLVVAVGLLLAAIFRRPWRPPAGWPPEAWGRQVRRAPRLQRAYRRLVRPSLLVYLTSTAVVAAGTGVCLFTARTLLVARLPAHEYLLLPPTAFYLCVVFFLSLAGGLLGLLVWVRVALGSRRARVYERLNGFSGGATLAVLAGPLAVASLATAVLGSDWYTRFDADRVVFNGFWGFGEEAEPYTAVTHVVETTHYLSARKGRVARPQLYVLFRDGRQWCYEDQVAEDGGRCPPDLVALLLRKTGRPLTQLDVIENLTATVD